MTNPPPQLTSNEMERVVAPIERERVEELLRLFGKAARAHQLYLPNNPVYKAAHDALRAAFVPIWSQTEELALAFTESEVKWEGAAVLTETTKGNDSLPWLFFKDGVREIRMMRGFEAEELDKLLNILQRVRKASPDEDDLLTMLWQGDFVYLRYRYLDLSVEATVPLADGGEAIADSHGPRAERGEGTDEAGDAFEEEETSQSRSGVVNMSDFDGTLYFLDEREIEYLQSEVRREYATDLRKNVVSVLLDIFEQQTDPDIRAEVTETLGTLMVHMLSAGQFTNVAYLVREATVAAQRANELGAEQRELLAQIPARLSAAEPLTQFLQSLDEAPDLPAAKDVLELFEQLRGSALGTVLDWLGKLQNARLRPMLEQAASRLASQNTAELVKLILSTTHHVALEAIRRAGAMQTPAAVAPIGKVLADGASELRLAAVQALHEIGSAGALQALERAVDDAERDVRVAAIRVLQGRAYRPMLGRLDSMVKGKAIREADLSEKMAVFEAYGTLCGDAGVAGLDGMLNGKSMFGRREDSEIRACAAVALGRIKTSGALASLQRAASEKDVVVRNAVSRAMRGTSA
ncbi:MAG: HEAT repeat domain-containing protein [Gemmatimonadota bacterium]